jgi:hypothetical protein
MLPRIMADRVSRVDKMGKFMQLALIPLELSRCSV